MEYQSLKLALPYHLPVLVQTALSLSLSLSLSLVLHSCFIILTCSSPTDTKSYVLPLVLMESLLLIFFAQTGSVGRFNAILHLKIVCVDVCGEK